MTEFDSLVQRLKSRSAVIGIIGLGYVGVPLAIRYAEEGFKVIGFDIDQKKVDSLNRGTSYIRHISDREIGEAVKSGFAAVSDFNRIPEVDAIIICVPTPLNKYREPDMGYIVSTIDSLRPHLRPGHVVSLESTTYPGTTEELIRPAMESRGLKMGVSGFLIFSPEREDPGRKDFTTKTTPKVVGGTTPQCLEVGKLLYEAVIDRVVPVSSTQAAEMTKLLENIHRAVNIGLVNEMKMVCDRMGIDINEVIDAAATKPFGFVPYRPGPGLGGHCIPIDPFYLTWKARAYGINTKFIELAGEINSSMPNYVIEKIKLALNAHKKSVKGSRILIAGLAYKKNVDDYRESPSFALIDNLIELGASVSFSDPYVLSFPTDHSHSAVGPIQNVEIDPQSLASFDLIVIATDHDAFPYELIFEHSKLIVDSRGRYRNRSTKLFNA